MTSLDELLNLVKKFLVAEELTPQSALAYACIGIAKSSGDINEIGADVVFNGHPYNEERKDHMADFIGEALFYLQILANSCGMLFDEIIKRFIRSYLIRNNQLDPDKVKDKEKEVAVSVLGLKEYVKTKLNTQSPILRDKD